MVGDADGRLYLVWIKAGEMGAEVRLAVRDPGASWSTPQTVRSVAKVDYELYRPAVAVDGDGNLSVAWEEYNTLSGNYDIRARRRDPAGAWASVETVAGTSANERRPALAAAPDGTVYLAWQANDLGQVTVQAARRPLSGTWTADYQSVPGSGWDHGLPGLAADGQGNVYLAYAQGGGDPVNHGEVYLVRRDAISSTWSATPELVSDAGYDFNSPDPPALAVDSQDNLFVAWGT